MSFIQRGIQHDSPLAVAHTMTCCLTDLLLMYSLPRDRKVTQDGGIVYGSPSIDGKTWLEARVTAGPGGQTCHSVTIAIRTQCLGTL